MTPDWITIGTVVGAFATMASFIWLVRRSQIDDLKKLIRATVTETVDAAALAARIKADEAINAVAKQVRALEQDIGKEFVRRHEFDRIENGLIELGRKVDNLIGVLMKERREPR